MMMFPVRSGGAQWKVAHFLESWEAPRTANSEGKVRQKDEF